MEQPAQFMARKDLTMGIEPDGRVVFRSVGLGTEGVGPAEAVLVLAFCAQPRTLDDLVSRFGPSVTGAVESLQSGQLLVEPSEADNTQLFFDSFTSVDMHRRMLADKSRVDSYAKAIEQVVKPGMVVADAGTGTGVLACIAARAGAKTVYAIDKSSLAMAQSVVEASGFNEVIQLIQGDFSEVSLPEKVDVVISETFGALALSEGGTADLARFCEANLAPEGVSIPARVSLFIAPVTNIDDMDETAEVFGERYGADLRPLVSEARRRGIVCGVPAQALGAEAKQLADFAYPCGDSAEGQVTFDQVRGDTLWGWAGWFDLEMAEGLTLSTSPFALKTHWKQQYLPIAPQSLAPNAPLEARLTIEPAMGDRRGLEVKVSWEQKGTKGESFHRVV